MDKFDLELIQKELNKKDYKVIKPTKITKRLIDKLINKNNTCFYYVNFYDAEGDSEKRRKQFNNWTDPYEWGIWGWTNHKVREEAKCLLYKLRNKSCEDGRCYYLEYDKGVELYFYGRDLPEQCDYWFDFHNEEETPCTTCKRDICWEDCKIKRGE
ncbi:hypothetical protein [Clostridium perfringens]|uniref:hypothetical protein n=1 Tax=Clostridium perfringens TaxID=1502 RepID=UPI0024BC865D|nr:hypothetical protein [Clostridium perfringens]